MTQDIGPTATFSLVAGIGALLFSMDMSPLSSLSFTVTVGVTGGLIGRAMWWVFVDSFDKWSIPARGAIAGAFTGWLTIFPAVAESVYLARYTLSELIGGFSSLNALLEFVFGTILFGLIGTIIVGWITIPTAALCGYFIGRDQERRSNSEGLEECSRG